MLTTRSALLEKIRLGEDSFFELKEVRLAGGKIRGPSQDSLADELAAFANSAGGVLLLGVEDSSRTVLGIPLEHLDAVEALLRAACEQSVKPPLMPIIERLNLPDWSGAEQAVMRVAVGRSLFVHQSPAGYMYRVGSSKRPIPPDQLARLIQQRSQSRLIRFDETPVVRASLTELDEALWRRFAPAISSDAPETLLSKLAMVARDDEGQWRPTVAGLLMAATLRSNTCLALLSKLWRTRDQVLRHRMIRPISSMRRRLAGRWINKFSPPVPLCAKTCVSPRTKTLPAGAKTCRNSTCWRCLRR